MRPVKDEDVKVLSEARRPSMTRTPPRVWPQVSQADMSQVVRRLRSASEPARAPEPRMWLVGQTG